MRKSFGGFALLLILLGVGMIVVAVYQVMKVPDVLEYVTLVDQNTSEDSIPADGENLNGEDGQSLIQEDNTEKTKTVTALKQMLSSLEEESAELSKIAPAYTWWGFAPKVTVSENGHIENTVDGVSLKALGAGYTRVYSMLPLNGRLFYEDELKYGDPVALVDEQLALKMFQTTDLIDREIVIQGRKYRIVGIMRHKKAVGDAVEYGVYLPVMALAADGGQQLDQFVLAVVPEPKAGTLQAMGDIAQRWRPTGTLHDTRKEKQISLLVPRWVSGAIGVYMLIWLARAWQALGKRRMLTLKTKLRESYMLRLIPWMIAQGIALLGLLGILIGSAYLLCTYMIQPILVHSEWVPIIPVEIEEITKTFWNLQWTSNVLMELRTPNVLRLRHFGTLASVGTMITILGMLGAAVNKNLGNNSRGNEVTKFGD